MESFSSSFPSLNPSLLLFLLSILCPLFFPSVFLFFPLLCLFSYCITCTIPATISVISSALSPATYDPIFESDPFMGQDRQASVYWTLFQGHRGSGKASEASTRM